MQYVLHCTDSGQQAQAMASHAQAAASPSHGQAAGHPAQAAASSQQPTYTRVLKA